MQPSSAQLDMLGLPDRESAADGDLSSLAYDAARHLN
jgi:hypothetical protein